MVHIPFLNIEVPEPRLAQLVPDVVTLILRMCTRAVDAAMHATHPLPKEVQELYVEDVIESFPREIQRVLQRAADGKHRDEDHVSEELEDASLDYYRRMIRTAAVGETDEDQEDVTAYKLGLDRPSVRGLVWDHYLRQHEDLLEDAEVAMGVQGTPEEQQAIREALAAAQQRAEQEAQLLSLHAERRDGLRIKVRSDGQHTAGTALRAGVGLALGIGAVRGVALLVRQLLALRKPKKGKKAKAAPQPVRRAAAAALPSPSVQPQQPQQQQSQQQSQQQQQQPSTAAASKQRPRTTTRKR